MTKHTHTPKDAHTNTHPTPKPTTWDDAAYTDIPLDLIDVGDQDLRLIDVDDGIIELAADIAARGQLQPIGVTQGTNGRYQLHFGKRRFRALRRLNRTTARASIYPDDTADLLGDAIAENLHRVQLTIKEECDAVARMHLTRSPDQIAAFLNRSRDWVLRRLSIPSLPLDLRAALEAGRISLGAAEALSLLTDTPSRELLTRHTITEGLSIAQVRQAVTHWNDATTQPAPLAAPDPGAIPQHDAPMTLVSRCQLCGTTHPDSELLLIRVCAGGCPVVAPLIPDNGATNVG